MTKEKLNEFIDQMANRYALYHKFKRKDDLDKFNTAKTTVLELCKQGINHKTIIETKDLQYITLKKLYDDVAKELDIKTIKEASIKKDYHNIIVYNEESWDIYSAWINNDNIICWYDARITRDNTVFKRIFTPREICLPEKWEEK